jgi:hypothetical protein
MYLHDTLLACPACNRHAWSSEATCPTCGAPLRNADGSRTRTAGAVLLGLALAAAPPIAGCSGSVEIGSAQGTTGAGGGSATTKGSGGAGGTVFMTDYGVPATTSVSSTAVTSSSGGFGGAQADYGVPATTSSSHAASSSGGTGGAGGGH